MTSLDEHQRNAKHTKNCIGLIEDVKTVKCLSDTDTELLNKYVSENKEIFETDGRELFCKICNKSIPFDTKCLVHRHLKAKKHQTVADKGKETKKKYLMKNFAVENSEVFEVDDAELFCKVCNTVVPSDKLNCLEHLKTEIHIENYKDMIEDVKKVPVKRLSGTDLLNKYVSENKEVFETDGSELFCKVCIKPISFNRKFFVYRHLQSKKHQTNLERSHETESETVELLNKYVSENNEVFEADGELLLCKVCKMSVSFGQKRSVDNHLNTRKHKFKYAQSIGKIPNDVDAEHVGKVKASQVKHLITEKHNENCKEMVEDVEEAPVKRVSETDLLNEYAFENKEYCHLKSKKHKTIAEKDNETKQTCQDEQLRTERHIENCEEITEDVEEVPFGRVPDTELLNKYVFENEGVFETDGNVLFCKICNKSVSFESKSLVYRHLQSKKHQTVAEHLRTEKDIENSGEIFDVQETHVKRALNTVMLKKYVSENKEVFETDGSDLICKICKKSISFESKFLVYRHLQSKKHKTIVESGYEPESKTQEDRELIAELLNMYVSENNEVFEADGELLLCKVCKMSVPFEEKRSVDSHLKTQKHRLKYAQSFGKARKDVDAKHFDKAKGHSFILQINEDFCRTCMKQFSKSKDDKQSMTEIPKGFQNNISIMKLLENIQPHIKVEINGNLPTFMCSDCIQKLLTSYDFIEMYQNSDKRLKKMLDEFDTNTHDTNLDDQQEFLDEMEMPIDLDVNNCDIKIEPIHVDDFEKEIVEREYIELRNEPIEDVSDIAENNGKIYSSSDSDDEWTSEKSCLDTSVKQENSDKASNKVFKGFLQPEENNDGSLTCQLCETVLKGVLYWRKHIRLNHLKENPKRANKRRTNESRKKRNSKSSHFEDYSSDEGTKKVLKGVLQSEAMMRQNHFEEKPKRAVNRRSNGPTKRGMSFISKRSPPNADGLYHCEFCGKTYSKHFLYRRHLLIHKGDPYLCVQCGKSFSLRCSYKSHMLRHKGEKTFQCPHCPKSFVVRSGLYNHARTHNDKPYVCNICGSAFRIAYDLKVHNLYHTGLIKYKCEYCDMRFLTAEKQRRHMCAHTGEKPYRCKYCERSFAQSNDWVKHLRQHLGDNVYQCDLCPLRFPLVSDLRVHFATHKDDNEEIRARNLQARAEEERNLQIRLGSKEIV